MLLQPLPQVPRSSVEAAIHVSEDWHDDSHPPRADLSLQGSAGSEDETVRQCRLALLDLLPELIQLMQVCVCVGGGGGGGGARQHSQASPQPHHDPGLGPCLGLPDSSYSSLRLTNHSALFFTTSYRYHSRVPTVAAVLPSTRSHMYLILFLLSGSRRSPQHSH